MSRPRRTSRRRSPVQERSRATVDAILEATARLLVRDGYEHCSTNQVARQAGVSVGTLYQYFSSKEALVLAVMERHMERLTHPLETRLAELVGSDADLETVARELVHQMLEMQRLDPKLHKVLIEQVPRVGALGKLTEMSRRFETLLAAFIEAHPEQFEVREPALVAYVLVTAVEALTHHVVMNRPELLSSGRIEEHMVRLMLGYVAPSIVAQWKGRVGPRRSRAS